MPLQPPKKRRTGFALMTPERRKEVARRGYARTKAKGMIYTFTPEDSIAANQKKSGTLSLEHSYTYTRAEKLRFAKIEAALAFYNARAQQFGRERNLPIGANRPYEKYPEKEDNCKEGEGV